VTAAWNKTPHDLTPYSDAHMHGKDKDGTRVDAALYANVPGLSPCYLIRCEMRPGCYQQVGRGELPGNDEQCVDRNACRVITDQPSEFHDECFEPIPKTAGPTDKF